MRRFALAAMAAAVLTVVGGVGGAARADTATPEGITPSAVTVSLGKGSSTTVASTLHLNALPPKADVLLALDTTGSMGAAIADATRDANDLISQLQASIPQTKFAVAEFKDYGDTLIGTNAVTGLPWRVAQDFTDNSGGSSCETLTPIACALSSFTANGGGDEPEAYNTAFFEAGDADPNLHWEPGASRFVIVLGDSLPHDAALHASFPDCPNTSGTADQPPGSAPLTTLGTLATLKAKNTNLSFVTYNDRLWQSGAFRVSACQGDLAAYTGGSAVTHDAGTAPLKNQIVNLINQAAGTVDNVSFNVTGSAASWLSFFPTQLGPITAPADVPFTETVSVPAGTAAGQYTATVKAVADGTERGSQVITVNVTSAAVSALTMSADEPSIPAGIASVPFGSIPGSRLAALTADVNSGAAGSLAAGSIAAGSIAAGSIAAGSIAAGSIAAGSIAAGSIAAGSIGFGATAAGSIAAGSIPSGGAVLKSVLLSQIPLVGTTWADILKDSPFANQPLQGVTLYDVANYGTPGTDGQTPWQRLMALPLRQVPFFQTLWRSVPLGALLLGNATIGQLPPPKKPDGSGYYASWSDALTANGGNTTGVTSDNTVFGLAISGNLGTTNVGSIAAGSIAAGSIAAGSIAAGSIAAGSIAAGSIDFRATTLGQAPLSLLSSTNLSALINCGSGFACTGKTLGDASAAGAIKTGVTLLDVLNAFPAPYNTITIDSLAQGILAVSEYPWEQINVQGLQDVAGTGQNVHYHVDFDLVCSAATTFSVHVKLPSGFFPAAGSSKFSYAGGTPQAAADPTVGTNGPVWSTLPGSPCGGGTATRHVRLDFTSYAGLTLGSQSSDVDVTAGGVYSASSQAPVLVTQNWEPSDDASTAPAIDKNTLIVGHIASAGDTDFYRFPVTGLAPGTKVTVYLKVPRNADLDLVVNRPGAPGVASTAAGSIAAGSIAAGSIAAGSIPLEDSNPSVDNSTSALQPDAASDLAAGSIAAGSIAAGSISANRGIVNEAAQIVTRGETGNAVIGVSGYNSAFSNDNYVLRVKVTPPPALPACPPVTGLGTAAAGNLIPVPTATDASVKALFLVNRQRLVGLYPDKQAQIDSLLNDMSSPLNSVASQVGGKVLQIDGDQTVQNAYQGWDANPCSIAAANTVVRSINNLVANYRAKYPNLKYVVLLGTDTSLPSWRQQDLSSTSPEVDEANDLAFSTSGLTKGNAIYAAAAQNAYLTDQAYGAFKERVWLGHDVPVADVSVSRLVETPDDIAGQLSQYLAVNGHLNPQSALTTGDSFFSDGAAAASASLGANFGLSSTNNATLLSPTPWTHQNVLDAFFQKTGGAPDIGALWAHYSHWVAQPALVTPTDLTGLATTADVAANAYPNRLLFTVGCHSALNVPDTIASVSAADQKRLKDWAQAYMAAKAAVYIGNTGFGYGDTDVVDLSERLMDHFAAKLDTGGTIGEQWVQALHQYYSEPSNYDVLDEKVMVEANMYGLPFYDFGSTAAPAMPPTVPGGSDSVQLPAITANVQAQAAGNGRSLFVDNGHPDGSTYTDSNGVRLTAGTLTAFYRPMQPTVSRDVTIADPNKVAHGAWISSLATHTVAGVKPVKPFPVVFSPNDRPAKDYPNIFFPANLVTINRDAWFGQEHDTAVVNLGKFVPNDSGDLGTEQLVDSIGLQVGYSASPDVTPPLITQVGAVKDATGFNAFVHVSDASGLARVAVLWAPAGSGAWTVTPLSNSGGGLWTAHITTSALTISIDAEAEDTNHNDGFSFNKAVHFQSFVDNTNGPSITLDRPLPGALFTLNDQVKSSFACSDPGGVASCVGKSDNESGQPSGNAILTGTLGAHTFTITATDLSGKTTTKVVPYFVLGIFGFKPPVDNPPVVNLVNAGSTAPVKWSLKDATGNYFRSLSSVTSITSSAISCTGGATDPDPDTTSAGLAGLKYDLTNEQFVYNWPTLKAWKGTCRRLYIGLVGNGVLPYADFQFK